MPEISRFYGIIIKMFFDDHNPPHFHALYGDHEVLIDINTFAVFAGHLPPRALGLVIEWTTCWTIGAGHKTMSHLTKLTRYRNFKNIIQPTIPPDRG